MNQGLKGFIGGFIVAGLLAIPIPVIAKEVAKTVKAKENVVTVKADKEKKSGQKIYIIDNKVYVPATAVAKVFHKNLKYDAKANIVVFSGSNKHK